VAGVREGKTAYAIARDLHKDAMPTVCARVRMKKPQYPCGVPPIG
jgi:hypothetical protein